MEDSQFNKVPKDVLMLMALEFNFEDLLSFCATNKYTRYVCSSQQFWKNKLIRDYPEINLSQIRDFKAAYYHFEQNLKDEAEAITALTNILYLIANKDAPYYINNYEQKILEKVANIMLDFPIANKIYAILKKIKILKQKRSEQRISVSDFHSLLRESNINRFQYLKDNQDYIIYTIIIGTGLRNDLSKKKKLFPIKSPLIHIIENSGHPNYSPVVLVRDSEVDYNQIREFIDTRTFLPFEKNMKSIDILPCKYYTKVIIANIILDADYLDYFTQLASAINIDWDLLEPNLDLFIENKHLFTHIRITNAPIEITKNKKLQQLMQ